MNLNAACVAEADTPPLLGNTTVIPLAWTNNEGNSWMLEFIVLFHACLDVGSLYAMSCTCVVKSSQQ